MSTEYGAPFSAIHQERLLTYSDLELLRHHDEIRAGHWPEVWQ